MSPWLPQCVTYSVTDQTPHSSCHGEAQNHFPRSATPQKKKHILSSEMDLGLRSATPMLSQRHQHRCIRRAALKFSIGGREPIPAIVYCAGWYYYHYSISYIILDSLRVSRTVKTVFLCLLILFYCYVLFIILFKLCPCYVFLSFLVLLLLKTKRKENLERNACGMSESDQWRKATFVRGRERG